MARMLASAVEQGFTLYGFSPHSPICIPSPCNMKEEDVAPYLQEVRRLREEYAGRCRVLAGMEIDYLGPQWGPALDYFKQMPLDFRIGSVHFIPAQNGEYVDIDGHFDAFKRKMRENFQDDIRYVVETFYSQSVAMVQAGAFDILGHLDKIAQNAAFYAPGIEDEPFYKDALEGLIEAVVSAPGLIVELNTKAFEEHSRFFPVPAIVRRLRRAGVPVIVNSDAHRPERINSGRLQGLALLDRIDSEITGKAPLI